MEVIFSIVILIGIIFAVFKGLQLMMRVSRTNSRKELPLSPHDLKVLEETTARLMSDLKICTDECVARIDKACEDAERRLLLLKINPEPSNMVASNADPVSLIAAEPVAAPETTRLQPTADDLPAAKIAGESSLMKGEVELMQGLQLITRQ